MVGSVPDRAVLADRLLALGDNGYAPWLDRRPCRAVIGADALPELRTEAWRHTNVARWYETVLRDAGPVANGYRVQCPDGVEAFDFADPRASSIIDLRGEETFQLAAHPIAAVNGLMLGAAVAIRIPAGVRPPGPVRIEELPAAYQRLLVIVETDACVEFVEEPSCYTHRIVEVVVRQGGRLLHRRRQAVSPSRECSLVAARVEAGARYELAQLSLGGELRRNDIVADIVGRGAEVTVRGAWRLDAAWHLDNQVTVHHQAPGATSRQTFRGVVDDRSRAVLNGRIHIARDAQQSDATLSTKNLLASATAEVYAKPELEIYANDVKCSHGATVGAIDEDAMHYFRSRGIDRATAQSLLIRGFLREAIDDIEGAERLGVIQ